MDRRVITVLRLLVAGLVLVTGAHAKSTGVAFGWSVLRDWPELSLRVVPLLHVAGGLLCVIASGILVVWPGTLAGAAAGRLPGVLVLALLVGVVLLGGQVELARGSPVVSICHALAGIGAIGALVIVSWPGIRDRAVAGAPGARLLRTVTRVLFVFVLLQVVLGTLVRHLGAGLSIPDFPLAMGRLVPPLVSPFVAVHFAHRVVAMIVVTLAIIASGVASIDLADHALLGRIARCLAALTSVQIALGAYVIWWQRDVRITVAHVVTGTLVFVLTWLLWAALPSARARA